MCLSVILKCKKAEKKGTEVYVGVFLSVVLKCAKQRKQLGQLGKQLGQDEEMPVGERKCT